MQRPPCCVRGCGVQRCTHYGWRRRGAGDDDGGGRLLFGAGRALAVTHGRLRRRLPPWLRTWVPIGCAPINDNRDSQEGRWSAEGEDGSGGQEKAEKGGVLRAAFAPPPPPSRARSWYCNKSSGSASSTSHRRLINGASRAARLTSPPDACMFQHQPDSAGNCVQQALCPCMHARTRDHARAGKPPWCVPHRHLLTALHLLHWY